LPDHSFEGKSGASRAKLFAQIEGCSGKQPIAQLVGGTVISHEEAVQTLATEKYLLGELHAELRDQFEEHLYDCQEYAFDFWAAATFLAHAKVILSRQT
jgi:hypothetical protein